MTSRPSVHTGSAVAESTSTLKQRQVARLATRLGEMLNRFTALDKQVLIASEQAQYLRELGGQQAAFFMASSKVLTPEASGDMQDSGAGASEGR